MSKQEAREQRINEWLGHLRRCEAAGGSVVSYAKTVEDFEAFEALLPFSTFDLSKQ